MTTIKFKQSHDWGEEKNMACKHTSCPPKRGVWLPLITQIGFSAQIKRHPYCEDCGVVKNISGDKAKSIGFYTNVLVAMGEFINNRPILMPKFTKTQIRLIAKELESNDLFQDTYGTNLNVQKDKFIDEVRKYRPDLSEDFIKSFL